LSRVYLLPLEPKFEWHIILTLETVVMFYKHTAQRISWISLHYIVFQTHQIMIRAPNDSHRRKIEENNEVNFFSPAHLAVFRNRHNHASLLLGS
jgi:hypothetical protein